MWLLIAFELSLLDSLWQRHVLTTMARYVERQMKFYYIQIGSDRFDNFDKLKSGLDNLSRGHNSQESLRM